MSFEDFFSIYNSGSYLVQWSGTILAILVQGQETWDENFCEIILKSAWDKMSVKDFFFLFLALGAILFSGMEPF